MRHEWKRDWEDAVKLFDDAYPYYVRCRLCGEEFDVTSMGNDGSFELELGADDPCGGLDLSVRVSISIHHPSKATECDDRSSVAMSEIIPLEQVLNGGRDGVLKAIEGAVEVIAGSWRGARTAHESAWRTAVEAAALSVEGKDTNHDH